MAYKHLGSSVCDSLMNTRIILLLIKKFDIFFDDEMNKSHNYRNVLATPKGFFR